VGPRAGLEGGKSRPHRDSIPDRPARSQSLYRLSYPAHNILYRSIYSYLLVVSLRFTSGVYSFEVVQTFFFEISFIPALQIHKFDTTVKIPC